MHERPQRQCIETDAEITGDADQDQRYGIFLPRQLREKQRSAEGDNLCRQKEDDLSDRIQVKVGSDVDAVVDDRSDAVNVEEESDQEEKTFRSETAIFFSVPKIFPNVWPTVTAFVST